ncbi:MAG TPA: SRPBCC family protein [Gemmatimonadaceae bacterium]|nr:SRPBCC family protein [Gemmatimonadaceae bacterium]
MIRERGASERASGGAAVNVGRAERLASTLGGVALVAYGARRRGIRGAALAATGIALAQRGVTGHSAVYQRLGVSTAGGPEGLRRQHGPNAVLQASRAVRVERAVIVARTRDELYAWWRDPANMPRVMRHVHSVEPLDAQRARWRVRAPVGVWIEWETVIHNDIPGELIAWKSTHGAIVPNAGSVHFTDAPGGGGTIVRLVLEYDPPGGRLGVLLAKALGEDPYGEVREGLRRFKQLMETGEEPPSSLPFSVPQRPTAG